MALKTIQSRSRPSLRGTVLINRTELWKGKPVKALTEGKTAPAGATTTAASPAGSIGGGHKQAYRFVDFKRRKFDVPATVERLEYDPNRTAFIALVKYQDGELSYILAPQRLRAGDAWWRPSGPTSSRATRCRWRRSRSAPSSTTSR